MKYVIDDEEREVTIITMGKNDTVHELLHVRYSTEDEDWVNETTRQLLHSKYKY